MAVTQQLVDDDQRLEAHDLVAKHGLEQELLPKGL